MSLLTSTSKFSIASSSNGMSRFLFQTTTEAPLPEALEAAACLLNSACHALKEMIADGPGDQAIASHLHLVLHAVQAAEAIAWAACESDAVHGVES